MWWRALSIDNWQCVALAACIENESPQCPTPTCSPVVKMQRILGWYDMSWLFFSTQPDFDLGPGSFRLGREWRSWHVWILLSRTPSLEVQKIWIGLVRIELKWVWTKLFAQCQTMEKWHHQRTEQNPSVSNTNRKNNVWDYVGPGIQRFLDKS